jgi:hypothetical protein
MTISDRSSFRANTYCERLGRAVADDCLIDRVNRRKQIAVWSTGGFQERGEPILHFDLVAPGERVTKEEHPEFLTVHDVEWLSVSVPERVGLNADAVVRLAIVRVARPPEDRMVLHGLQIPRTPLHGGFRWEHEADGLIERKGEQQAERKGQKRPPHAVHSSVQGRTVRMADAFLRQPTQSILP